MNLWQYLRQLEIDGHRPEYVRVAYDLAWIAAVTAYPRSSAAAFTFGYYLWDRHTLHVGGLVNTRLSADSNLHGLMRELRLKPSPYVSVHMPTVKLLGECLVDVD